MEIVAQGWSTLTIPISLSEEPDFILATPKTTTTARINWLVHSATNTEVVLKVYNMEAVSVMVGFYVFVF